MEKLECQFPSYSCDITPIRFKIMVSEWSVAKTVYKCSSVKKKFIHKNSSHLETQICLVLNHSFCLQWYLSRTEKSVSLYLCKFSYWNFAILAVSNYGSCYFNTIDFLSKKYYSSWEIRLTVLLHYPWIRGAVRHVIPNNKEIQANSPNSQNYRQVLAFSIQCNEKVEKM